MAMAGSLLPSGVTSGVLVNVKLPDVVDAKAWREYAIAEQAATNADKTTNRTERRDMGASMQTPI
jgi:hypothetical protein